MTGLNGILAVDKPAGPSSAGVVNRVKRLLPRGTKVGHGGTLDPFATGLLLLLVGKATKRCESLMDLPKQYDATVRLGATTATDDCESPATPWPNGVRPVAESTLVETLTSFVGRQRQMPPIYSALKVGGRRAYDVARKGGVVPLKPREVVVYGMKLLKYDWPEAVVRVDCGRGYYVRALARDLGQMLDVGGHLSALRRTRVGDFDVASAADVEGLTIEKITAMFRGPVPSPGMPGEG